ncbi:MAG: threonine/serine dehydratase [Acidobacteria bacterium]|nr:threonine/serine dehydratase [Acidobacteriota bacterium]
MTTTLVALADVEAAAARIRGVAVRTPLIEAQGLWLKCENLQPMGAFKLRGAVNFLAQLPADARAAGVITYSSGNHGQAVALAAARLGVPAVVVMPETAPRVKVEGVRRYGGEVIVAGTTSVDRRLRAEREAAARGLTMVPPFDHPWIIAGAGTCGLEILEQQPEVSVVYVPVGGGGLIAGIAAAIKGRGRGVRVIGVEPAGAAKMSASHAAGHPVTLERTSSIADGLLPLRPGHITFAHVQALVDEIVTVSDEAIAAAVRWVFREARLVAEPSGAATVAAVLQAGPSAGPGTVAVVSGGNVSGDDFARYIAG